MTTETRYPLYWPPGRPRSQRQERSRFKTSFAVARDELLHELRLLGAKEIVLSTNIALRQDGLPLAGQREPNDPGVAVYFTHGKRRVCFACDRWVKVEENLYAVAKTVDAIRGIRRWGTGDMVDAAFRGYEALPGPGNGQMSREEARAFLRECSGLYVPESGEIPAEADLDTLRAAYRQAAALLHPDRNSGDDTRFKKLQRAKEVLGL